MGSLCIVRETKFQLKSIGALGEPFQSHKEAHDISHFKRMIMHRFI